MADDPRDESLGLGGAPPQFQRMLSWQLSQVIDYTDTVKKSKKKKKKQKDSAKNESLEVEENHPRDISVERVKKDGYTVTNSDGEDEVFYSAPQTPDLSSSSSDNEAATWSDEGDSLTTESLTSLSTTPGPLEDSELVLMEKEYQKKESSKKSKKKRRRVANKMARAEFFQPLCNLIEDKMQIDVDGLDLRNFSTVPSLCELCLRKIKKSIKKNEGTDHLPYLVTSLVSSNQGERDTISKHVQWVEKWLASKELELKNRSTKKQKQKAKSDTTKDHVYPAYRLQGIFAHNFRPVTRGEIPFGNGLHVPLPYVLPPAFSRAIIADPPSLLLFLHYTNYMYPLMVDGDSKKKTGKGQVGATGLTEAQRSAIYRVNHWIEQRYPSLSSHKCKEELKLWPGYVHWSRGNMQLAAEAFVRAFDELETNADKIVLLNEMARMFVYFNERSLAVSHYNKSNDISLEEQDTEYEPLCDLCQPLIVPCNFALQASVWDTGPIDGHSAILARQSWDHVIKTCDTTPGYPSDVWCLHVAAIESKMFVHAGRPVEVHTPDRPCNSLSTSPCDTILKWCSECEGILMSNTLLTQYPILYYHLSLILAIKGDILKSQRAFQSYIDNFAGFGTWDNSIMPGNQFYRHLIPARRPHPWKNLFDLLPQTTPPPRVVPILPLRWRVRLLHPLYPYMSYEDCGSLIADHSPYDQKDLNLRLTAEGYLTGDMQMDLPPMKTVLIDPYTGDLCFSRRIGLQHCYYSYEHSNQDNSLISSLPWPLRVYETDDCVVELLMMFKPNLQGVMNSSCSMCVLDRYSSDGSHQRIDLRKIIRKERRKAILETADHRSDVKNDEKFMQEQMDALFNGGFHLNLRTVLYMKTKPSTFSNHYSGGTVGGGGKKRKKQPQSNPTTHMEPLFYMYLLSHMVLGDGTVRLLFSLEKGQRVNKASAIVYVNCNSYKEFLHPRVYVVADDNELDHFYPGFNSALHYQQYHMKYIRYSSVAIARAHDQCYDKTYIRVIFDSKGDIVARRRFKNTPDRGIRAGLPFAKDLDTSKAPILGERCYKMDSETKCVTSWSIYDHTQTHQSSPIFNIRDPTEFESSFKTVPGLVLIECPNGLVVLRPGTLERVNIEGCDDGLDPPPQDGMVHPQFVAPDAKVQVLSVLDIKDIEEVTKPSETNKSQCGSAMLASLSRCTSTVEDQSHDEEDTTSGCGLYVEVDIADDVVDGNEADTLLPDDVTDYGSGCVVISVNDRLLVLECLPRTERVSIKLDVKLPGRPLNFHVMKGYGYLVTVTQFPDTFRSDLYWLSPRGHLLGMLPCLGTHPHSLYSALLPSRTVIDSMADGSSIHRDSTSMATSSAQDGGMHVFFNDGVGSLCCLRLKDALNPY